MVSKLSSLDDGYTVGDLSLFPEVYDTTDQLFIVTNNAETETKQAIAYNASKIILKDASSFPDKGIMRIGTPPGVPGMHELIYYATKNGNILSTLSRGYAGSRQNYWPANAPVTAGVMAEHHNAVRDAVYNIEHNLGVKEFPEEETLNWILQKLEKKWISPRALFRAFPVIGPPPLEVRFQNFSLGNAIRFLWDFGDGGTSTERNPIHTYLAEGEYPITLNVITETGGTAITSKSGYIFVDDAAVTPFFYVVPEGNVSKAYSIETAAKLGKEPTTFKFVDQTDGDIVRRFWVFDDGTREQVDDPNIHTTTHVYQSPDEYEPSLLIEFADTGQSSNAIPRQKIQKAFLTEKITVF